MALLSFDEILLQECSPEHGLTRPITNIPRTYPGLVQSPDVCKRKRHHHLTTPEAGRAKEQRFAHVRYAPGEDVGPRPVWTIP